MVALQNKARGKSFKNIGTYAFLVVFLVLSLFPFIWMVGASLKSNAEIFNTSSVFPSFDSMRWENYEKAWSFGSFEVYFSNTIIVALCTTVLVVLTSSLSGYALSKFKFAGRNVVFYAYIAILMIPAQVTLTSLFHQLREFGLYNTRLGLILPYTSRNLPFAIFLLKGYFDTIPNDLIDAATIDGTTQTGAFFRVMLPIAIPGLVTVTIITLMNAWQEFLYATTFISKKGLMTLSVGLTMFQGENVTEWAMLFAATTIATLPIVVIFLAMQRFYMAGIMSGALKG